MYYIMNYNYIVNPETGRKVNINGKIGRKVLQKYRNQIGGSSPCTQFHGKPVACQAHSQDGVNCVYTAAKFKGEVGQCRKSSSRNIESARESARNRDSLVKLFEEDAGNRVLKALNRTKFKKLIDQKVADKKSKQSKKALEEAAEREIQKEAKRLVENCSKCGLEINFIKDWNANNCDECIPNENIIFGEDNQYFRLRKLELEKFDNDIYPKLNEMTSHEQVQAFVDEHYDTNIYQLETFDEFKKEFLQHINSNFFPFYKKVNKLYNKFKVAKADIADITDSTDIKVGMDLDNEIPYYYNNEISTYDLDEIVGLYCSNTKGLSNCNKVPVCTWQGKQIRCTPGKKKNACFNKYVPGSKALTKRVKKGSVYMDENEGECIISNVGYKKRNYQ